MGTAGKVILGLLVVGGVVVGVYFITRPGDKPAVKPTKASGSNSDVSDVSGAVKSGFDFFAKLIGKNGNLGNGGQQVGTMPHDYSGDDNFNPNYASNAVAQDAGGNPLFDPNNFA